MGEQRHVGGQADHEYADQQRSRVRGVEHALAEHPQRQDRFDSAALDQDERNQQNAGRGQDRDARHRVPVPHHAALEQSEQEQRTADREQDRAGVVDLVAGLLADVLLEAAGQYPGGRESERDVHEEDPAPGDVVGEDPAQRRPDERRDAPDAGDVALHLGPLGHRVDVADDRHPDRLDRAGAKPLDQPERDQSRHAPREPTQYRADHEQPDAEQHDRLAAAQVGELAVDRDRDCLRKQVDREQPRELGEATEIVDDGRYGGGQDGRVDRHQPDAQHHREQDRAALRSKPHPRPVDLLSSHDKCQPT